MFYKWKDDKIFTKPARDSNNKSIIISKDTTNITEIFSFNLFYKTKIISLEQKRSISMSFLRPVVAPTTLEISSAYHMWT